MQVYIVVLDEPFGGDRMMVFEDEQEAWQYIRVDLSDVDSDRVRIIERELGVSWSTLDTELHSGYDSYPGES
jgi:hypothetical protein